MGYNIYMDIIYYVRSDESSPLQDWLNSLDNVVRLRVLNRLARIRKDNLGVHKSVGDGVSELIFTFGAGYRVYYATENETMVLLNGGDKSSQSRDIIKAKELLSDHHAN